MKSPPNATNAGRNWSSPDTVCLLKLTSNFNLDRQVKHEIYNYVFPSHASAPDPRFLSHNLKSGLIFSLAIYIQERILNMIWRNNILLWKHFIVSWSVDHAGLKRKEIFLPMPGIKGCTIMPSCKTLHLLKDDNICRRIYLFSRLECHF